MADPLQGDDGIAAFGAAKRHVFRTENDVILLDLVRRHAPHAAGHGNVASAWQSIASDYNSRLGLSDDAETSVAWKVLRNRTGLLLGKSSKGAMHSVRKLGRADMYPAMLAILEELRAEMAGCQEGKRKEKTKRKQVVTEVDKEDEDDIENEDEAPPRAPPMKKSKWQELLTPESVCVQHEFRATELALRERELAIEERKLDLEERKWRVMEEKLERDREERALLVALLRTLIPQSTSNFGCGIIPVQRSYQAHHNSKMPSSGSKTSKDGEGGGICERLCRKQACAIQFCLQRSGYQEHKCAAIIQQYHDCCEAAKRSQQQQTCNTTR
ncbi:Transmembrane protein, partial [Globisporangium splendens]